MRVYVEAKEEPSEGAEEEKGDREESLPPLEVGEALQTKDILPRQHFTQPSPRYSEATLVKELEEKGIGRPSTYASIVSTIKERDYIRDERRKLYPTELGKLVSDLLAEYFPDILNVTFTAHMEDQLDEIEEGRVRWTDTLSQFYQPFQGSLERAQREMKGVKGRETPTDISCEKCDRRMVIKWGRKGYFLACPGYPECKNTAEFVREGDGIRVVKWQQEVSERCEKCGRSMLIKEGRFGQFLACSGYPKCKNTRKLPSEKDDQEPLTTPEETQDKCERCGSPMVIKRGRYGKFLSCSGYPECKFIKPLSLGIACPMENCQGQLVSRKTRRGRAFYGCSKYPECNFALWERPVPEPCPQCQAPFLVVQNNKGSGAAKKCFREECDYQG
jgi:DNA topoisomerase-1